MQYEKERVMQQQTMEYLNRYESDFRQCENFEKIGQKLEDVIRKFWAKQSATFFSRVKDLTNQYLTQIGVDMSVTLEEERMEVLIRNERLSLGVLSSGERTVLNLLARTAIAKELNERDILILDHPTAMLDRDRTLKFFSFLDHLKKDFKQIIMTTQRDDPSIEADKRIALNGGDSWHEDKDQNPQTQSTS
jgi:DNA repair exonuclease SbcCD ATPase subunit